MLECDKKGCAHNDSASRCHGLMRPEDVTHVAHRLGDQVLGLLPRVHCHLRVRCEGNDLHGDGVGMRRGVVRHDQDRRLAASIWACSASAISSKVIFGRLRRLAPW